MSVAGHEHYHSLRVVDTIKETADSRSFILEIPAGLEETFHYKAGQFCTFRTRALLGQH